MLEYKEHVIVPHFTQRKVKGQSTYLYGIVGYYQKPAWTTPFLRTTDEAQQWIDIQILEHEKA
jgi:hypothetical protein